MTELLLRMFVKNTDPSNVTSHTAVGKLAGTTGIVCNILLFAAKLAVGLISGAVSVVADALNNLSDAASSVVTLLGFRLAQRPADKDHPYGHARYEYLSGLIIAVLILFIGVELVKSSIQKIFAPTDIAFSVVSVVILLLSIGLKLWMCLFYRKLGLRIGSTTLKAASVDSRNDVLTTGAVLLGCVVSWLFRVNIDGYVGLAVAIFILCSGIGVAKETISPLLGEGADPGLADRIGRLVGSHEKVLGIHDLLVHDYGPGKCYASVHVELSAQEDPLVCHDIIDDLECLALENLNVHLVIHYDPVLTNDAEWMRMRELVEKIVRNVDPELSTHDFRLVRGACQTKLVFDLAVPYEKASQRLELRDQYNWSIRAVVDNAK